MDTSFWTDRKVDDFTPEDKYFMCYLLTGPYTKQLGIYEISIKYVAIHLGYSEDTVNALLERFERKYGIIIYSKATSEVAVKGYLRHSIIKGGKPVEDCIKRDMQQVRNKCLIAQVFEHLSKYDDLNDTVKKIINEYENDNGNDNGNDNDNEDSYPESGGESLNYFQYGTHKNVFLTDDELEKLKSEYSDFEKRIEKLSAYMASTGKTYENHYATIRSWAINDKEKPGRKEIVPSWMASDNKQDYDFKALEVALSGRRKTAGNDPNVAARAEALRKELGGDV